MRPYYNPWGPAKGQHQKGGGFIKGMFCNWCGKEGHKKSECKDFTAEMRRRRGQVNTLGEEGEETQEDDLFGDEELEPEDFCLIGAPEDLCAMEEPDEKKGAKGWHKEVLLLDSAAGSSFLRKGAPEHIPILPAAGKDPLRTWTNASGGEIKQQGVSEVLFVTQEGEKKKMRLRRSQQVQKNVASIAEISDKGTCTLFTRQGGCVIRDPTGEFAQWIEGSADVAARFDRTGNVYTMPMWIKGPANGAPSKKAGKEELDVVLPRSEFERLMKIESSASTVFRRLGK